MAKDKASVLLYRDIIHVVEKLDDKTAGLLFKHYLRYINDLEPKTDNSIVEIVFEPIKQNLKRDLKSYKKTCDKNRDNAFKRWDKKDATASDRIDSDAKDADTDTDKDTVIDKDIYKRTLLLEISKEKFPMLEDDYIKSAQAFQQLFIKNQEGVGIKNSKIKKAKGTWIDDIRLMRETDQITNEQFRKVFEFLKTDNFWDSVILSTSNLRKKFTTLLMKANNEKKSATNNSKITNLADGVTD